MDIKPEAIEIAQLRLWLALVVDQTLEQARPLPNLDYKLMAGNSLIETIDGEPVLGELATQILSADDSTPVAWDAVRDQLQMFDPNPTQARMLLFESEKEAHHERIKLDETAPRIFQRDAGTPQAAEAGNHGAGAADRRRQPARESRRRPSRDRRDGAARGAGKRQAESRRRAQAERRHRQAGTPDPAARGHGEAGLHPALLPVPPAFQRSVRAQRRI